MLKHLPLILSVITLLGSLPHAACAYNEDVHFNLTYVLCRLDGLPLKDALWVADADQSMDENDCTNAFPGGWTVAGQALSGKRIWVRNGQNWHDFSGKGGFESLAGPILPTTPAGETGMKILYQHPELARQDILERFNTLKARMVAATQPAAASDNNQIIRSEIALGQFLHFEQDYFAHRQLTADCTQNDRYLPYGPIWGHFSDKHTPDYVGARPNLADLMVADCDGHIRGFVNKLYGKDLRPAASPASLKMLVTALAHSYHFYHDIQSTSLLGSPEPYLRVKHPPTQKEVDGALSGALQSLHVSGGWVTNLPYFAVPNNTDFAEAKHPFALPYDTPDTPLLVVEKRIDNWIDSENLSEDQGPVSLVGKWSSSWGPLELKQDYTGSWEQADQVGQIKDGAYDPNTRKFVFHYYQPWNRMNGTTTMTLSSDGNTLSGSYTQANSAGNGGFAPTGAWTMTRDPDHAEERNTTSASLIGTWSAPKKLPAQLAYLSQMGSIELKSDGTGTWSFPFKNKNVAQIKDLTYDPKERSLTFHYYQPKGDTSGRATLHLSDDETVLTGMVDRTDGPVPPGVPTKENPNGPPFVSGMCFLVRSFAVMLPEKFVDETGPDR